MKKRALTLLEVMVVIFLITLITGVVGYNLKGSMDKGRRFKTEQGMAQLRDILLLAVNDGNDIHKVAKKPEDYIGDYAKNPKAMVTDGWGAKYTIEVIDGKDFKITSKNMPSEK